MGHGHRKIGLTDGLASTAAATSTTCLDTVFFEVSVICVARARVEVCLRVVFWTLILVSDEEPDGRSESNSMFDSGLDLDQILFVSLSVEHKIRKTKI